MIGTSVAYLSFEASVEISPQPCISLRVDMMQNNNYIITLRNDTPVSVIACTVRPTVRFGISKTYVLVWRFHSQQVVWNRTSSLFHDVSDSTDKSRYITFVAQIVIRIESLVKSDTLQNHVHLTLGYMRFTYMCALIKANI